MILEVRTLGDPVLREKCRDIDYIDNEVKSLTRDMGETMKSTPGRVGLAASQVGVLKRLFVYDIGRGTHCLINPEIIEEEGEDLREEGCLSIPGVYIAVPRFERVMVRCKLPSGHRIVLETEGFLARVMQHECDHLQGVLIIDRCDTEEKKRALEEYQELSLQREQATA